MENLKTIIERKVKHYGLTKASIEFAIEEYESQNMIISKENIDILNEANKQIQKIANTVTPELIERMKQQNRELTKMIKLMETILDPK